MAAARPQLPEEVKVFILNSLAAFDTPSQVAAAVKEEFEIEVSRQVVQAHDPTKFAGHGLAAKWREIFNTSRTTFLIDATQIPIANRSARLRALNRMANKAEKQGNIGLAARLYEQAAKETGNAYTNRVDLTSSDGTMSPPSLSDFYGAKRGA